MNTTKTEELVKRTDIVDSPFVVVTTEEGSFVTMGKYRLTEPFESEEEAIINGSEITWNRIIQVLMLINQEMEENKELLTKITE